MLRTVVRFTPTPIRRRAIAPTTPVSFDALVEKLNQLQQLHKEITDGIEHVKKVHAAFEGVKQGKPGLPGVGLRGKPGVDGKNVTQEQVEAAVQKYVRQPKDGESADPATVAEQLIQHPGFEKLLKKHLKHGKDGNTPATDAIVTMVLEELQKNGAKKISLQDIEGLETKLNELRGHINASKEWRGGGDTVVAGTGVTITNTVNGNKKISASGGNSPLAADLSSQCNGSNLIFTIPAATTILSLIGTDAPIIYRPNVDFTVTGTTLTVAGVNAPSNGATLILNYVP